MSRPQTYEQSVLLKAENILNEISPDYEKRLKILETCASLFGGFDINSYWAAFGIVPDNDKIIKTVSYELFNELTSIDIPASLALSSLSREPITVSEKKKNGVFYTDYRLAQFIADSCKRKLKKNSKVADIAVGSGILLAGIADCYYTKYPDCYENWISECVYAFDLSENALRSARIALSVHTNSINALLCMTGNWRICDSLLSSDIKDSSYDIILGNPPWGKIKLSLHSYVNSTGAHHIYGSEYDNYDNELYLKEKANSQEYSKALKKKYSLLGTSEPDMYMAFLQKAMISLKPNGYLAYIVPAGLIRSKGTEQLRRYLINESCGLRYYLLDNRAKFFEIDSRFKFLIVTYDKATLIKPHSNDFELSICTVKNQRIHCGPEISFNIADLEKIRPDLTIPECRSILEKDLFFKICENGFRWKEKWSVDISREVDMTNDRPSFENKHVKNGIPVIEGRMVHQFRFGVKAYLSGSGRSAKWEPTATTICPQFYIKPEKISKALQNRIKSSRIGYCDIAGQTNERAMMSCIIPPNVVCGNKVPTIIFNGEDNIKHMYLWLGVTNSFVFDWLLRRVLSTTVNYFLLFSLPMPNIKLNSSIAKSIISKSIELSNMGLEFYTESRMPMLRAEIDVLVAKAFGLDFSDIELIMNDFPLLDRSQPPIEGEHHSTVTRDLILSTAEKYFGIENGFYTERINRASDIGAKAYIPTDMKDLFIMR